MVRNVVRIRPSPKQGYENRDIYRYRILPLPNVPDLLIIDHACRITVLSVLVTFLKAFSTV
jgi:hypothetical protein